MAAAINSTPPQSAIAGDGAASADGLVAAAGQQEQLLFEGPTWNGPVDQYTPDKLFHPPTKEQAEQGWTQNWDKYKMREDKTIITPQGSATIKYFDLSGGQRVAEHRRAAERSRIETEAQEWKAFRLAVRERVHESQRQYREALDQEATRHSPTTVLQSASAQMQILPLIGLGTWKGQPGETKTAVEAALRAGYRHIDCAEYYGNEQEVGEAFDKMFRTTQLRRSEVFVTGKLWNANHGRGKVEAACRKTLKDLRLRHLDLYLIHWPVTGNRGEEVTPSIQETWEEMEKLVDLGLVKALGMSNFSAKKVEAVLEYARVRPAVVQAECHPYWRNETLVNWCLDKGIHFTAYSPLGSPDSASLLQRKGDVPILMKDPAVLEIAARVGHDVGQVLVRWGLQHRPTCSVLPKSVNPKRIQTNFEGVQGWSLSEEDMHTLNSLPLQCRMVDGSFWLSPHGPYRTLRDLWDEDQ